MQEDNPWYSLKTIPQDIRHAHQLIYHPSGLSCSKPVKEKEGVAYGAHTFMVNDALVQFRTAKTTPLKAGHFVTFWKRLAAGPIAPYDSQDPFDFLVISVCAEARFGQFVFPKSLLLQENIISKDSVGGKRALRIYPDWCTKLNDQASKTQQWQSAYFLDLSHKGEVDLTKAKALYQFPRDP